MAETATQIEFEGQLVMDKTVGLVGLGIMGGAIARNLVSRGWRVIGFDVDAARRAELSRDNVNIADNASQVARDAPVIMTSLPNPADVARAIANSGQPPRIVVELSTLSIADKLIFESILKSAGHIALDCPLSGTGAQARKRDLVVYASGTALRLRVAPDCSPTSPSKAPISAGMAMAAA
jgi:3-hydroxyisobutyrate dehydrogenase/glyoxylate/succinic semialdehyde reductase